MKIYLLSRWTFWGYVWLPLSARGNRSPSWTVHFS